MYQLVEFDGVEEGAEEDEREVDEGPWFEVFDVFELDLVHERVLVLLYFLHRLFALIFKFLFFFKRFICFKIIIHCNSIIYFIVLFKFFYSF